MQPTLAQFDDLPDEALVTVTIVAAVTTQGVSTIWRKSQTEPLLKPIQLGRGVTRFRVGPLRQYMAGKVAA